MKNNIKVYKVVRKSPNGEERLSFISWYLPYSLQCVRYNKGKVSRPYVGKGPLFAFLELKDAKNLLGSGKGEIWECRANNVRKSAKIFRGGSIMSGYSFWTGTVFCSSIKLIRRVCERV